MSEILTINIRSDFQELKETLNIVLTQIKNRIPLIQEEAFMDFRLIFTELLINAIKHGNKRDTNKNVYIIIEFSNDHIVAVIADEGNGFNYLEVLKHEKSDKDLWHGTGRGIQLVHSLADELLFNTKGNEIKFVKNLG